MMKRRRVSWSVALGTIALGCAAREGTSAPPPTPQPQAAPSHPTEFTAAGNEPVPERDPRVAPDMPEAAPEEPLKIAFDGESQDASWSDSFEGLIVDAMRSFPSARLTSVACKTTVCKIEVSHGSVLLGAKWIRQFPAQLAAKVPEQPVKWTHLHLQDATLRQSTLYLTRPGYSAPSADGTPKRWPAD